MKKSRLFCLSLLLLTIIFSPTSAHAAIDPYYKECLQRNYEVTSDENYTPLCQFKDGKSCPLEAFNNGECGQAYKTEDYCTEAGNVVWDEKKCCPGTQAYLERGMAGQTSCQNVAKIIVLETKQLLTSPFFLIYVMPTVLLLLLWVAAKIWKRKAN